MIHNVAKLSIVRRLTILLLTFLLLPSPTLIGAPLSEPNINGLDAFIERIMKDWKVPGLAVAIVKDGKIAYAKGFGYRDVKKSFPVTPDTLFAIGSCSKAFTAAALGILVDEGKLEWDKPVREYMPDFRLQDEYATQQLRPRDLVTHQSGLPRHDLVWYGSPLTRNELYERLRYLEPSKPLFSKFQYNNLMYMTAGVLVERISGQSWEEFVKNRILKPLEMKSSNFSVNDSQKTADFALPYREVKEVLKEIPFRNIDAIGPAGSINSSVNEMANWLMLQLAKGKFKDQQIISERSLRETHSPQIIAGINPQYDELSFAAYAMGWSTSQYRGHPVLGHSGGIDGFITQVRLLPKANVGFVILTNSESNAGALVAYNIMDRLLGLSEVDWNQRAKDDLAKAKAAQEKAKTAGDPNRKLNTQPSHHLKDYVGQFTHPAYGELTVSLIGEQLRFDLHGLQAPLKHYHYDVFEAGTEPDSVGSEASLEGTKIAFSLNKSGEIISVALPLEPSVKDIVFTRKAAALSKVALNKFIGEYELEQTVVKFFLRGDNTLMASVPGQPEYELVAKQDNLFSIKGLDGFTVEFKSDATGKVTGALFTQPNGTFTLKKR